MASSSSASSSSSSSAMLIAESSDSEDSEAAALSSDPSESDSDLMEYEDDHIAYDPSVPNIVNNLYNRQLYGRFTKGPNSRTEKPFKEIPERCRYAVKDIFPDNGRGLYQIHMGFTRCGRFFLTFDESQEASTRHTYELFVWRFIPGRKLRLVYSLPIFGHFTGNYPLEQILFMQFPNDSHMLICAGIDKSINQESLHISLLSLDESSLNCRHCLNSVLKPEELERGGLCLKHGFAQHFWMTMSLPAPIFDPLLSLSCPDQLIINCGHAIHILKVSTVALGADLDRPYSGSISDVTFGFDRPSNNNPSVNSELLPRAVPYTVQFLPENDSRGGNKPFHELNISCEPLNVTGKNYPNTLVILDSRIKRLQNSPEDYVFTAPNTSTQKQPEKNKVLDKKIAEKTYEFTEDNEKYEKISLFRKKRLADKKYEFSEDNTENIVPFHILRRERRYLRRAQGRSIRSPDLGSLFLSPRSPGCRSPMQSPSSRNGQFSPGGARHIYCSSVRNLPYYPKSPVSPRDCTRVNMYSQGLEENCSDLDSGLVLRNPISASPNSLDSCINQNGLILLDSGQDHPKWIKKTVRRYTNGDYENGSLLSGDSRDDYNNPLELPVYTEDLHQHPEDFYVSSRRITHRHVVTSQTSIDFEQFIDHWSRKLCERFQLFFKNSQDYNVKITKVCPIRDEIRCAVYIKIGACETHDPSEMVQQYCADCTFVLNFITARFDLQDSDSRLIRSEEYRHPEVTIDVPKYNSSGVRVLNYRIDKQSKISVVDADRQFEIYQNHVCADDDSPVWLPS